MASLAAHAAVVPVALLVLLAPENFAIVETPARIEIARMAMPPEPDEPYAIDKPIPPEELSGYEISGLPFNMAKIAARKDVLFPFLTEDLSFIERVADA